MRHYGVHLLRQRRYCFVNYDCHITRGFILPAAVAIVRTSKRCAQVCDSNSQLSGAHAAVWSMMARWMDQSSINLYRYEFLDELIPPLIISISHGVYVTDCRTARFEYFTVVLTEPATDWWLILPTGLCVDKLSVRLSWFRPVTRCI